MSELKVLSMPEQIAAYLREELARGRWRGTMPGRAELARQLEVGITSMEEALRQLEREGVLTGQGTGRMRRIVDSHVSDAPRSLRIVVLTHDPAILSEAYLVELVHLLREDGHHAVFSGRSLTELGMNAKRVRALVEKTEADAWIVCSGSREIVEWFATQEKPAFAFFGRRRGVPIASVGPDKAPAYAAVARRLIELDHQRIVLIARPERRLPIPGTSERAFLDELAAHGVAPGPYHLPDWEDGIEGFQALLDRLFRVTPPTALIVDEVLLFVATQQFLARRRLRVPEEVSLVSLDADPAFAWCLPSVAHVSWDHAPVLRRAVGWARHIARGKKDLRETLTRAEFIDGGTIGQAMLRRGAGSASL